MRLTELRYLLESVFLRFTVVIKGLKSTLGVVKMSKKEENY